MKALITAALVFWAACCTDAGTLQVISLADSGPGSLRDRVMVSNPGDTIVFGVTGTIQLNSSITISHTLYVLGPGPDQLVVDGQHMDRLFITSGNPVFLAGMTMTNGFVAGANGSDAPAPGLNGGPGDDAFGGAILNNSNSDSLYISNCWVTGNSVQAGRGGAGGNNPVGAVFTPGTGGAGGLAEGGALYATGAVYVINCTFSGNRAVGGQGGGGGTNFNPAVAEAGGHGGLAGDAQGGAVNQLYTGNRTFQNVTFSANRVGGGAGGRGGDSANGAGGTGGDGGSAGGGAVATLVAVFVSDTIVSNAAIGGIGGVGGNGAPPGANGFTAGGTGGGVVGYLILCLSTIENTIVADNFASGSPNFAIAWNDQGYNFFGTDDPKFCTANGPGTQIGTLLNPLHPQLGPLAQNGGGMPTHAVLLSSPVLDAGSSFGLSIDERFAPRPDDLSFVPNAPGGDGSDIGAFELGAGGLGATQGTNGVVVSWPTFYADSVLQFNTNLQGSNSWVDVDISPVVVSNRFVVTNPVVDVSKFYRLINRPLSP